MMNRIRSVYRSWAIPRAGTSVYSPRHREGWLAKLVEPGVRIRAQHLYQQLDCLESVRLEARRQLLLESRKHAAVKLLREIPSIGPIRGGATGGPATNTEPFSHQAAALGLQRFRRGASR